MQRKPQKLMTQFLKNLKFFFILVIQKHATNNYWVKWKIKNKIAKFLEHNNNENVTQNYVIPPEQLSQEILQL